jgi:nucleotide-binding universal stress UspA family protein
VGEIRLKNILLPTAGGAHSRLAEEFGVSLARSQGGELVVCGVVPPDVSEEREGEVQERLDQALERVSELDGVRSTVVRHKSVSVGIIQEAKNHDTVIVGASREGFFQHILFGSIPESVAKHTGKPVIVVKHHSPVKALVERVMEE